MVILLLQKGFLVDIKHNYTPSKTQALAHSLGNRYKLFGGAMGGGKSRWLCEEIFMLSMQYPGNRGVVCRYHLSDFKNSTLKTLLECLPSDVIADHNQAEHLITLINGSEIIYLGLSEEENVSKLKSMELGWFAIDEASEVSKDHFLLFQSRLRRKLPNGTFPRFYGLLATNPEDCWLKDDFVLGQGGSDYVFIPSLPRDNPYLPSDYEQQLKKTYPEMWIKRFLEGSWDDLTASDVIIPSDWVRASVNKEIIIEDKPIVAFDIARFGDDEIVGYFGRGGCMISQDISSGKSLMETVGRIINMRKKNNAKVVVVDDAGLGGGVTDRLREMKEKVIAVNGGEKAIADDYANLKTELWWNARKMFEEGVVSILNDPILIRQLSTVKYKPRSNGKLMCEPKDEVKSRIGQSPDRADALVLMLWGTRFLRDSERDFIRYHAKGNAFGFKEEGGYGWNYYSDYPVEMGV